MTEDLERLCAELDNLADLLDSNDDESNAAVCRKAKDAIKILYTKADEFYAIANNLYAKVNKHN